MCIRDRLERPKSRTLCSKVGEVSNPLLKSRRSLEPFAQKSAWRGQSLEPYAQKSAKSRTLCSKVCEVSNPLLKSLLERPKSRTLCSKVGWNPVLNRLLERPKSQTQYSKSHWADQSPQRLTAVGGSQRLTMVQKIRSGS